MMVKCRSRRYDEKILIAEHTFLGEIEYGKIIIGVAVGGWSLSLGGR